MADLISPFDHNFSNWKMEQSQPWMTLRYRLEYRNISRHIGNRSLSILDAGGGNAASAILFAEAGHTVTVVDFSTEMVDDGIRLVSEAGLESRISIFQADLADLPALFPEPSFDLILCHNVVQYLENPAAILGILAGCGFPGGLISMVTVNQYAEVYKAAIRELDLERAITQLVSERTRASIFDISMRKFSETEVIELLEVADYQPVGLYGLLCLTHWLPNEPKYDPAFFSTLETLEYKIGNRFPYYLLARFYQVIGVANGNSK
jgi:SAM-dependent methyltransferase